MSEAAFTDLYQLTMMQAAWKHGMNKESVFDYFPRKLPENRNYLVAAGLEGVLDYLQDFRFSQEEIDYLDELGLFEGSFLLYLRDKFRFTGDVFAVPEGTPIFPNEPLIEVVAPYMEAQFFETYIINQLQFQTMVASKAARIVHAAQGIPIIEMGARRAHGIDAANKGSRAAYIAGITGTSNIEAGRRYGIPVMGTMAHSYILAHDSERQAFLEYLRMYPNTTILVDTFSITSALEMLVDILRTEDVDPPKSIRIDSGDLDLEAERAAAFLRGSGFPTITVTLSGDLDEYRIARSLQNESPVSAFGVGTRLIASIDAPQIASAYKLVEYDGVGKRKLSTGKVNLPGKKQVVRSGGAVPFDKIIATGIYSVPGLLEHVMNQGHLTVPHPTIEHIRRLCAQNIADLPEELRELRDSEPYLVLNDIDMEVGVHV